MPSASPPPHVTFTDVTRKAGLEFEHYAGAFGQKWMPETMGSGCAWIDYDASGRQSLLLLNGTDFPGHPGSPPRKHVMALYRNDGGGKFTDVTTAAGLDVPLQGMGVAVGDWDNDGHPDFCVTALDGVTMFRNRGDGKFERAPLPGADGWCTSAAFVDYDNDGLLDLFVCRYVRWTPETDVYQTLDGKEKAYARPDRYPGLSCLLFHNEGKGKFRDVTQAAGVQRESKALGVAVLMRPDGWADLYVVNDTVPNLLYINQKNGTFKEEGIRANVATGEDGRARGGMGTDAADYRNEGSAALLVTNFSNEMLSLYRSRGNNYFTDASQAAGLGASSRLSLGFGCFFFDYDLDGLADIFVANGHIEPDIQKVQADVSYAQRPLLYHNQGTGGFDEVGASSGDLAHPLVARGTAWADYDGDGFPDIAISTSQGAAHLYHNDGGTGCRSVSVRLRGVKCNRSAIGAQVFMKGHGSAWVKSGSSYCSQSQLPLLLGMGRDDEATLEVQWPGTSSREPLGTVRAGETIHVEEGRGIVQRTGR